MQLYIVTLYNRYSCLRKPAYFVYTVHRQMNLCRIQTHPTIRPRSRFKLPTSRPPLSQHGPEDNDTFTCCPLALQGSCNGDYKMVNGGGPAGVTPSSTTSSSTSSGGASVSVPLRIHSVTDQYLGLVGYLRHCHESWDQADLLGRDTDGQRHTPL